MSKLSLIILFSLFANTIFAQDFYEKNSILTSDFKILFYNVENLFDCKNDTSIWDEQFLPDGDKHWNEWKYKQKLKNIAKVINAAGGWQTAALVGLCEIENDFVLNELTTNSPLKRLNYRYVHKESPDRRGIDVALLYQSDQFTPIYYHHIPIIDPKNKSFRTREILYVKGITNKKDTLHVFVNHWPSRWGGQAKSEPKRIMVAQALRIEVDSLFTFCADPNIIIMGDFNDTPSDLSVSKYLNAKNPKQSRQNKQLYNLLYPLSLSNEGTHPYQGRWAVLDHMVISSALLNKNNSIYTSVESAYPFKDEFLLEIDSKYGGLKTNRTYLGYKYHGGYSDHLPIVLDLFFKK